MSEAKQGVVYCGGNQRSERVSQPLFAGQDLQMHSAGIYCAVSAVDFDTCSRATDCIFMRIHSNDDARLLIVCDKQSKDPDTR